ncbi:endonuclease VII domain-containing protein [Streptomyces griseoviridis]|uniref:endonuclease VII domain-containing protein n=1 Tax=Streptomyces griseoviridis TaxID=45398 RepID=UPI0033CD6B80
MGSKASVSFKLIEDKSQRTADGCLIWKGAIDSDGKPRHYDPARYAAGKPPLVYVRRWVVEQRDGQLAAGVIIEDICDHTSCVAQEHLVAARVATGRRTQAGINTRKTKCVNGHDLTLGNIYWAAGGRRQCKQCRWESAMRSKGLDPDKFMRGMWNGDKTHCPKGHPYDEENTRFKPDGSRGCKRCHNDGVRKCLYGIGPEVYDAMLESQGNSCAICRQEFRHTGIRAIANIDHNHETGKVRALLCENCNKAFGLVGENVETLAAMIAYKLQHG